LSDIFSKARKYHNCTQYAYEVVALGLIISYGLDSHLPPQSDAVPGSGFLQFGVMHVSVDSRFSSDREWCVRFHGTLLNCPVGRSRWSPDINVQRTTFRWAMYFFFFFVTAGKTDIFCRISDWNSNKNIYFFFHVEIH